MAVSKCGVCNAVIPGTIINMKNAMCKNCKYGLKKNKIRYPEVNFNAKILKSELEMKDPDYSAGLEKYSEILNEYFYSKQEKKSKLTHPALMSLIPVIILNLIISGPFTYMIEELIRYFSNGFQTTVLGFFFGYFALCIMMSAFVYLPSIAYLTFLRSTLTIDEINSLKGKSFSKEDISNQQGMIIENLIKEEEKRKEKTMVKCPSCKSTDIQFMQNNKKAFSVGKAVGGAVLTGGVGTLAGFAGKKGDDQWRCNNCGEIFATEKQK